MRNKIAMYFRFWGVGVELGGREKLLWAMLLLEEALKNSSYSLKKQWMSGKDISFN